MSKSHWSVIAALIAGSVGVFGAAALLHRLPADPAELSGTAVDTCFDCKAMPCDHCPKIRPCMIHGGYCHEIVRNLSEFCVPKLNGQWEDCKWRVEDTKGCVTEFLNPCTPEHVVCTTPINGCGPKGLCIPEGVCIP